MSPRRAHSAPYHISSSRAARENESRTEEACVFSSLHGAPKIAGVPWPACTSEMILVGLGLCRRPLPAAGSKCDHRVVTEREIFVSWVQSVLRDAEIAVHNGDAGPRRAIWSRNDPVTVLGAWKNASGQEELDELFAHLAESFSDCTSYEFELLEAEVRGDTAYTVGFEHTSASVNGVPRTYTLRATQIYRREGGAWKVAHRHGSAPPD